MSKRLRAFAFLFLGWLAAAPASAEDSIAFVNDQGEEVSSYTIGTEVTVRLERPDLNETPAADPSYAYLLNLSSYEAEYLSLLETGPDTGIFVGSMPLLKAPVQSYNHTLSAMPGDQLQVALAGLFATAEATALSLTFIDEQGEPTEEVLEGGEARVRMLNVFANTDPESAETVSVEIEAIFTEDAETLELTETGPDTGLFEGSISQQRAEDSLPDGVLQVFGSGAPDHLPEELTVRSGSFEATATTIGARVEFIDSSGVTTASYGAGETVRVRITDHIQGATGSSFIATLWALPPAPLSGDSEEVWMQPNAPGSAVFEGSVPTVLTGGWPYDSQLSVHTGDQVEVRHTTASSPIPLTAQATIGEAPPPPNQAPQANPDYAMTPEDQSVTISVLANDTDPDEDVLTVVAVTQPAEGTVAIDPGESTVTYTPAPNAYGKIFFQVTVSDPGGLEATSQVFMSITPVNDPPVANDDEATTPEDTQVLIEILANDSDIDSEFFYPSNVTGPAHGTVQSGPSGTRYTPDPGFSGVDTFSYTLVDTEGATDTAVITVTVTPVAPPRVTADLQVLYELEEGSGTTVADTSGVGTPLNLTIGSLSAVTWIPGGLSIDAPTLIQSAATATKVVSAVKSTHSITLEAWVEPANTTQMGPAPVVTVSQTSTIRNFTLGQNGNRWEARVRTSNTNPNGYGHNTPVGSATPNLTHVVYTRDASTTVKLYINGTQVLSGYVTGTFATWPTTQKLGLAAELNGANPWLGEIYLVAVYNRALSAAEVQQNWEAGQ